MNDKTPTEKELTLKQINTGIAAVGAAGVIASIWFGIREIRSQAQAQLQATNAQTQSIEEQWAHRFFDEKLAIYTRATEAAARLATSKASGAPIAEHISQFQTLYWGPMCITEGDDVQEAMVLFLRATQTNATSQQLQTLSRDLARICRNEARTHYLRKAGLPKETERSDYILEGMRKIVKDASQTKAP